MNFELCKPIDDIGKLKLDKYICEEKKDGTRTFMFIDNYKVTKLLNRSNYNDLEVYSHFKEIELPINQAVLDGEMVVIKDNKTQLNLLQQRENWKKAIFIVFDILEIDNKDLRDLPLIDRKKYLEKIKSKHISIIDYSNDFSTLWKKVVAEDREGVVLKLKNSKYIGYRSGNWLKYKNWKETTLEFKDYEENDKGITLFNDKHRVAINGVKSAEVRHIIEKKGRVNVEISYLRQTETGHYLQPRFKEVKENESRN